MLIKNFTPGQYRVTVADIGASDNGEDYIRQLGYGLYRTLDQVQEAIAADKQWAAISASSRVIGGKKVEPTYKIHFCPDWQEIDIAGKPVA